MEEVFIEIYKKYYNDVYRIAYSYTLKREDAEDILQKTFIKLYRNIHKFKIPNDEVKKWLFKVAVNEAKDYLKMFWRKKKVDLDDLENIKDERKDDSNNELLIALNSVSKKYRIPFYLYYYEGYKIKEIANIMNLSESAIKTRLSRVKEKLKKELEENR